MGKMLTQEYVENEFSKRGYKVLSEYKGTYELLEFLCPEGHTHLMTWNDFQSGSGCGVCLIKRQHSIDYVQSEFKKKGFELISSEYVHNKQKLIVKCSNNHIIEMRWNDFQQGVRCRDCSKFCVKDFEFYDKYVGDCGYRLIDLVLGTSRNTRLLVECCIGHRYWVVWPVFQKGARCRTCFADIRKKDFNETIKEFNSYGYEVLSETYENANKKLNVMCPVGHCFYISWGKFSIGQRCAACVRGNAVSRISQEWLDDKKIPKEFREFSIFCGDKKLVVDGFDPKTNTVYEFLGDYWHGNPNVYDQDLVNTNKGNTFGELFDETMNRLFLLRKHGYDIDVIWESEYRG